MKSLYLLEEAKNLQEKASIPLQLYKTTGKEEYLSIYESLMKQSETLFDWYKEEQ